METLVFALLFTTTALYAAVLARFKHLWEPDYTWLEVVVGCVFVLAAPAVLWRMMPGAGVGDYERWVWVAFVVGGGPIILWRISAAVIAALRVQRTIHERKRAATLAEECGGGEAADD